MAKTQPTTNLDTWKWREMVHRTIAAIPYPQKQLHPHKGTEADLVFLIRTKLEDRGIRTRGEFQMYLSDGRRLVVDIACCWKRKFRYDPYFLIEAKKRHRRTWKHSVQCEKYQETGLPFILADTWNAQEIEEIVTMAVRLKRGILLP